MMAAGGPSPAPWLLGDVGRAALARLLRGHALLAFDFDGTLTAIRDRPEDVAVEPGLARRLGALAERWPVAIITGRRLDDVRGRLGFRPAYIVGNHGAEDDRLPAETERCARALDPLRAALQARAGELAGLGARLEDKGASLALHYRTAPDPARARRFVQALLDAHARDLHVFGGKAVLNAVAADAPDKAQALRGLVRREGAEVALFIGDDVNDEPVFAAAEPGWVTARLGEIDGATRAGFRVAALADMSRVVDALLARAADAA